MIVQHWNPPWNTSGKTFKRALVNRRYRGKKKIGETHAGKPHVRFDEGAERMRSEIEDLPITAYPFALLYCPCAFVAIY